jgi:hypothetical protein
VFAAIVVVTPLAGPLGMAAPPWDALIMLLPFPIVVWGADELWRAHRRSRAGRPGTSPVSATSPPTRA